MYGTDRRRRAPTDGENTDEKRDTAPSVDQRHTPTTDAKDDVDGWNEHAIANAAQDDASDVYTDRISNTLTHTNGLTNRANDNPAHDNPTNNVPRSRASVSLRWIGNGEVRA